jgi:predicted glycosyltransferase
LGHLRRTLTLAEAVTDRDPESSALIITGSAAALGEARHERIDIIKLPELSRDAEGDLHAARLGMDTSHLHELRAHLAFAAAETFMPSVVVVDKTPLGLNDELVPTLEALRAKHTKIVLGLRDIEDAPHAVRDRWVQSNLREPISRLYDSILVYGPESGSADALTCMEWGDLDLPVHHVGYVGATMPDHTAADLAPGYLLVTAGGGVDGFPVFDTVLSALEHRPTDHRTVMVTGPLMPALEREALTHRAARLGVQLFEFRSDMSAVIAGARAVVTMAGYNTVSEVVRAGKPALLIPRTGPSEEQLVRAQALANAGVATMLHPDDATPGRTAHEIDGLFTRDAPDFDPALYDGAATAAEILCMLADEHLIDTSSPREVLEAVGAGR